MYRCNSISSCALIRSVASYELKIKRALINAVWAVWLMSWHNFVLPFTVIKSLWLRLPLTSHCPTCNCFIPQQPTGKTEESREEKPKNELWKFIVFMAVGVQGRVSTSNCRALPLDGHYTPATLNQPSGAPMPGLRRTQHLPAGTRQQSYIFDRLGEWCLMHCIEKACGMPTGAWSNPLIDGGNVNRMSSGDKPFTLVFQIIRST